MQRTRFYILAVLAILLIMSCESSKPRYVLSSGDMEEVLYDMHRAHFSYERGNDTRSDGAQQYALFLNVLKKHGVSTKDWDSTMVYYTRHSDELEAIYANLNERLDYEASAIGASRGESADTTDIWSGDKNILLMASQPFTTRQWSIKADTLLKAGERITLKFTALYLHESERKYTGCVLAVRLANDSVVVSHQSISRTGIYTINVIDNDAIGIKEVKGMFMMHRLYGYESQAREIKDNQVLCIRDICLVHELPEGVKPSKVDAPMKAESDTVQPVVEKPEDVEPFSSDKADIKLPTPTIRKALKGRNLSN